MILCEISYIIVKRDIDGMEIDRKEEHVYLKMLEATAESIKQGIIPLSVSLTMQHIAELQGYSYAGINHITY